MELTFLSPRQGPPSSPSGQESHSDLSHLFLCLTSVTEIALFACFNDILCHFYSSCKCWVCSVPSFSLECLVRSPLFKATVLLEIGFLHFPV